MEKKNNIDWKETGLLHGLQGQAYDDVKALFEQIELEGEFLYGSEFSLDYLLAPVIRRIYGLTIDEEFLRSARKREPEIFKIMLTMLKTTEVQKALKVFLTSSIFEIAKQMLSRLDYETEFVMLFSKNYVHGLYQRAKGIEKEADYLTEIWNGKVYPTVYSDDTPEV